jgi:hypothetical protein
MSQTLDEPCFSVALRESHVETRGPVRFFRGHSIEIPRRRPDGVFAEWTWDGRRLVIRNDRYGAAPIFYAVDGNRFWVSPSLIKLIEEGAPTAFDEAGLALFLRLGFFVGEDTPFRAIRVVPPHGTVVWEAGRVMVSGGYRIVPLQRIGRNEAVDGFIELFRRAMARRPPRAGEIVMPLSGGCDSRHILMELCASGRPPDYALTIPRYPPRASEDERIAAIVARELGVPHRLLQQTDAAFASELRKNWATHLCADEHAWYVAMVDDLEGRAGTVYDGLGGALSVANRFLSREALDQVAAGRFEELARDILQSLSRSSESFLGAVVRPEWRERLSLDRAVERLAAELALHAPAPDPIKSFNFWTRIRRELALTPFALMRAVPTVYSPYLDYEVFDHLMSLPPQAMSPALASSDKSFHIQAVLRGYPQFAHIPFEDRHAPRRDRRAHDARLVADTARHLLRHAATPTTLLNRSYVLPRLAGALASRRYAQATGWLPVVALYLFQLDALAGRREGALAA